MVKSFNRRLLKKLEALSLYEESLIILTADHGEEFLEHGEFFHEHFYQEVIHVPLVLSYPRRFAQGRRITSPTQILDIMPTVLELLGIPTNEDVQGRSLVPILSGTEPG